MTPMSISEVARKTGLRASAIRYYESIGLLPEPARIGNWRVYEPSILQRLALIQTAQQAGFTLDEMRVLFEDNLADATTWHHLIQAKLQELNALLRNVQNMKNLLEDMLHCENPELADCIYHTGQRHKSKN